MSALRETTNPAIRPQRDDLLAQRVQALRADQGIAVRGPAGGRHAGAGAGRGMDFAGLRPYQPGDDPRSIDWRHTARRGRPFTKLFHPEHERPVLLLVDLGPSMQFGTRGVYKSVQAARASAFLAWRAADDGDRVGGIVITPHTCAVLPPRSREAGVLALIRAMSDPTGHGDARPVTLEVAAGQLADMLRPGSEVVVLSDFGAHPAALQRAFARLRRAARVTLVRIADPLELAPPPPGLYPVATPRGEHLLDLRAEAARADYTDACTRRAADVAALARAVRAEAITLGTGESPASALHHLFARQ